MSHGSFDTDGPAKRPRRAAWSVKLSGHRVPLAYAITSDPLLVEGRLIIGLLDERIAAFDPGTGAEAWSSTASCPGAPHPVVHGGAIFASLDGRPPSIISLDPATGSTRWTTTLEPGPPYGVLRRVAVSGDRVLVVNGAKVMALAADSGAVLWRVTIAKTAWPVGIAAEGEAVAVTMADGSERGRFTVGLEAATGAERWRFAGEGRIAPAISDGEVFCAGPKTTLAVLDAASGAPRWSAPDGLEPWSEPAITPDLVVVAQRISPFSAGVPGARIHALDRATGSPRWTHAAPGDAFDPHVVVGRSAVYATGETLRAIDRTSGEFLWGWSPPARTRMERRPAIGEGMIFVPTDKGLFALR